MCHVDSIGVKIEELYHLLFNHFQIYLRAPSWASCPLWTRTCPGAGCRAMARPGWSRGPGRGGTHSTSPSPTCSGCSVLTMSRMPSLIWTLWLQRKIKVMYGSWNIGSGQISQRWHQYKCKTMWYHWYVMCTYLHLLDIWSVLDLPDLLYSISISLFIIKIIEIYVWTNSFLHSSVPTTA